MLHQKIFVQIASYRDPELLDTISDCLDKAMYPQNLIFGICWQHDENETLKHYAKDKRFKIIDVDYKKSRGCCWARSQIQTLYDGEEFTMQIDSHHRFIKNWDYIAIKMLQNLEKVGFRKPLLTTYPPEYIPGKELNLAAEPLFIKFKDIDKDGNITCIPELIPNYKQLTGPVAGRFIAAGFIFTRGIFCREVPYDPNLYFNGEEITLAARAFTNGYDIFHPHRTLLFHHYSRQNNFKHWKDLEWESLQISSSQRVFKLLHGIDLQIFDKYGLGNIRDFSDYERYIGIEFSKKRVTSQCVLGKEPSFDISYDDKIWEESLIERKNHSIKIKQEILRDSYDYIVVAYRDENNLDIYRKDIKDDELSDFFSNVMLGHYIIQSSFYPAAKVDKWVVMPRRTNGDWGRIIAGTI